MLKAEFSRHLLNRDLPQPAHRHLIRMHAVANIPAYLIAKKANP